ERQLAASVDGSHDDLRFGLTEAYLGAPAADQRLSFFIYGNDDRGGRGAESGRLGFAYDTAMLAAGVDYRVDDTLLVGVMFGASESVAGLDGGAGGIALDSNAFTVYGSLTSDGWYADATAGMSFDDYGTITRTTGSTLFPVARADTEGTTRFATLDGGYTFEAGAFSVGPTAGVHYARSAIDGYREAGAGPLNLTVRDQVDESMIGSIGVRGATRFESGLGTVVSQVHLSFEHEFQDNDHRVAVSLPGAGSTSLTADRSDGDVLRFDATVGIQFDDHVMGLVDYDAAIGQRGGDDHAVFARIKFDF
ncbi:MAG: autotransporter outer membrane beta-barrel domain-containing protein, partial [Alphaproteobacteria bacterium]